MADHFFSRLTGLMGRIGWPSAYMGIYFPNCVSVHTLFTTLKPDILFLDKKHKILKIFPSAEPWRLFLGPPGTRHCLELPGEDAGRFGLSIGDRIGF